MEEKEDNSIRNQVLLFAVVAITLIALKINSTRFTQRLKANHLVVCGTILEMRAGKGVNVIYEFQMGSRRFEYNKSSPAATFDNYKTGITKILVAVEKSSPNNNRILSEPQDYEELDIKVADTMGVVCR